MSSILEFTNAKFRVFPVVGRIRTEIDFCFSQYYARAASKRNADLDAWVEKGRLCDRVFRDWIRDGYRGPGELSVYVDMLSVYLPDIKERRDFLSKASEYIKLSGSKGKKAIKKKAKSFTSSHRTSLMMLIGSVWLAIAYHKLSFAGVIGF